MALLDWMTETTGPVIEGRGVLLRPPRAADFQPWAELRDLSAAYLQPWEPAWAEDDLTRPAFRRASCAVCLRWLGPGWALRPSRPAAR